MSEAILGIDLGTTNSEVALVRDGQPHVFAQEGDPILPSFVGVAEDGRLLVGTAARNQWVLASHGDTQLGGDDFDDLLFKHVASKFQADHGIDLEANLVARARLLRAVETAKRNLSFHPFARIEEEFLAEKDGQALHLNVEI